MTVKEWAEAYRAMNEAEMLELTQRLPKQPIEESLRAYFELALMFKPFVLEAEASEGLQELREREYRTQYGRWKRLADRLTDVARP